ncbi:hypothetical protein [Candidatus Binatus sp.]|uniref:hypothetical protein n=1 Tax=Candidatus Binatus sp. TaxID=2811406 RepID=UPI003CB35491
MRLRPTLSAAFLGSVLLGASLFVMAADDSHPPPPANPEYSQWAHFKPGTYVTLERKVSEHGENHVGVVEAMAHPPGAEVMRINTKMVDLDKDKAVLEETRIDLGDGSETQMPADKVTLFANGQISNASDSMWEPSKPETVTEKEGDEDVTVMGNKLKTHWVETTIKMGNEVSTAKDWLSDDVPGGLVKEETKKTWNGKLLVESATKVIDYKLGS